MSILHSYCHHATDPWFNMAFDEVMLGEVIHRPEKILLRLYTWSPGAITIGVNQQVARAICVEKLGGTPLLRRITGGRAVYHDVSELTYAVALNLDNPGLVGWQTSVTSVYLRLAEGLRLFLGKLGRSTQIVRRVAGERLQRADCVTAPCFQSAARCELTEAGAKLLASAQRQSGTGILQHGSIKLHGVVWHPALAGDSQQLQAVSQPIEQEYLERFSTQFTDTLGDWFGVSPNDSTPAPLDQYCLADRLAMIRTDPLGKRIPVERGARGSSLLLRG